MLQTFEEIYDKIKKNWVEYLQRNFQVEFEAPISKEASDGLEDVLAKGKISPDVIALLDKWRHTGFNAYCGPRILP